MTVSNDIRAALETTLAATSGLPTTREYDGVPITPVPGVAHVVVTIVGKQSRPATVGVSPQYLTEGLLGVTLYYPVGTGAKAIEAMADAIVAQFPVDQTITKGSVLLRVRYAETSGQARVDAGLWLTLSVTIAWYVYSN